MAAGAAAGGRSLEITPTWALATVCFVFIFTGIIIEHSIHLLTNVIYTHTHTYTHARAYLRIIYINEGFPSRSVEYGKINDDPFLI